MHPFPPRKVLLHHWMTRLHQKHAQDGSRVYSPLLSDIRAPECDLIEDSPLALADKVVAVLTDVATNFLYSSSLT